MKKEMKSVPLIIYENEMKFKNKIIIMLLFILVITICLFVTYLNNYDFVGYEQNGEGINNVNGGNQGDILNESTIENKN